MHNPCRTQAATIRIHAGSMLNQRRTYGESMQSQCKVPRNPCRTHAKPVESPCKTLAKAVHNRCRFHADHARLSFAAFAPQLDDELASLEALELLLPRKLATCFCWRPALARLLAAWASSLRTFSTTESRRAVGPVAYAACFSRRRCKARAFSGSDSGAVLR